MFFFLKKKVVITTIMICLEQNISIWFIKEIFDWQSRF